MENNVGNSIKYVVSLIILCFLLLGNSGVISKYLLSNIRSEVIPLSSSNDLNGNNVLEEVIPVYGSKENNVSQGGERDNNISNLSYDMDTQTDVNQSIAIAGETNTSNIPNTTDTTNEHQDIGESDDSIDNNEFVETVSVNLNNTPSNIGIQYSPEQLNDFEFLIGNCYTIDGSTSITSEDINVESMLGEDLSIDLSGEDYKVLVYHTHGSEAFVDSRPGVVEDTIIGVGDELTRILEEDYGIKTFHDRTVYDMVDGKLDRNYAYTQSGNGIDKILEQYPSIEVVLDVHRDGVRDDVHLMKVIDGKPTAQIMFFNGISRLNDEGELGYLHNPNLSSNLSFSLQMHLKGKALYGDLMRKIYIGGYCYNLDRKARASLIEVGAQTNTVEEAKNAMTPLAAIVYSVISGN
ncbi:MAG: stage II sporulation protein P [Lachnospiraceae bacterium]|nr:stage II sporulation protein P [Lachnospiraceae bacterium]